MADRTPQLFKIKRSGGGRSEEGDDDDSSNHPLPISTREGWRRDAPLFRVHGCWLTARYARSVEVVQAEFTPRPDDILLATFPKSGTTWLKALAFAVLNRSRHRHPVIIPTGAGAGDGDGAGHRHPLLSTNPHDLVPFLELPDRTVRPVAELEALPSPRLLGTHLPPALLPPASSRSRAVYLCREPKDVFVSYWHHAVTTWSHEPLVDFDKAFELFCEGVSLCGPVWDHSLEYWKLSKANPSRVLFLKYEEVTAEPARHVRTLAEFLGVPLTEEEEEVAVAEEVVKLCSFQNLKGLPVNARGVSGQIDAAVASPVKNSLWFRSGKVGDWQNHLTPEMARRLDCIVEEKLKGSGLTF